MSFIGVIPARFASTRFPGKPLAKILDKSMIAWVIENALESKLLKSLYVATDDDRIANEAEKYGAQVVMTDSDLPSGSDRVWAAIANVNCDWVLNIQGDEPLLKASTLDLFINECEKNSHWEMATLIEDLEEKDLHNSNIAKVILNLNKEAIYFSRFAIPFSRETSFCKDIAYKHIGIYAYKKTFLKSFCEFGVCGLESKELLEQLRALYMGAKIGTLKVDAKLWGVDKPEDIKVVEEMITRSKK